MAQTVVDGMASNLDQLNHIYPMPTERKNLAGAAVSRIEGVLESAVDSLLRNEPMSIRLVSHRSLRRHHNRRSSRQVHFPGRSAQEAQRFARVLLILQLAHDALVSGTVLTKRNIFYQHQELFEKQRIVDELVDDIATTLGLDRESLNIVASAKGIMAGQLKMQLNDGIELDASYRDTGIDIPTSRAIENIDVGSVQWVLVIEKDATFRSLSSTKYWQTAACGKGLLVTAKGYPDMITRSFLHSFSRQWPDIPIFVLADFDPDGLNIFFCYLHGTGNILTDSTVHNPSIRWLGIKSCHLTSMDPLLQPAFEGSNSGSSIVANDTTTTIFSTAGSTAALTLTSRDRKVIIDTLGRFANLDFDLRDSLRRELQVMQMLGYKAEIQLLDDAGKLDNWLDIHMQIEIRNV